jgi:hypothetical protein
MARPATHLSLTELLTAPKPRQLAEDNLIKVLSKRLPKLGIVWNRRVFRSALRSPRLPRRLLRKLENLLEAAEATEWDLSSALTHELDETIEDIESFNPAFREALNKEARQARRDLKEGRTIPFDALTMRPPKA